MSGGITETACPKTIDGSTRLRQKTYPRAVCCRPIIQPRCYDICGLNEAKDAAVALAGWQDRPLWKGRCKREPPRFPRLVVAQIIFSRRRNSHQHHEAINNDRRKMSRILASITPRSYIRACDPGRIQPRKLEMGSISGEMELRWS